jgi:hypothetical protein
MATVRQLMGTTIATTTTPTTTASVSTSCRQLVLLVTFALRWAFHWSPASRPFLLHRCFMLIAGTLKNLLAAIKIHAVRFCKTHWFAMGYQYSMLAQHFCT